MPTETKTVQQYAQPWVSFTHKEITYDLSHLRSYTHTYLRPPVVDKPVEKYEVSISFSHHTFTDHCPNQPYDLSLRFDVGSEERIFNVQRWELSKHLPRILRELAEGNGKCIQTARANFLKVVMIDGNGIEVEYEVFFRVWKPGKARIQLHVESAYVRDNRDQRPKGTAARFFVILHNTMHGRPIRL